MLAIVLFVSVNVCEGKLIFTERFPGQNLDSDRKGVWTRYTGSECSLKELTFCLNSKNRLNEIKLDFEEA